MENREPTNQPIQNNSTNNTISFLALAVAVAALVLAWVVYNNQPGEDFKETVRTETKEMDEKMDDAAQNAATTTREAAGAVVEKTGEAMESAGEAAQEAGTDIKNDNNAMPR